MANNPYSDLRKKVMGSNDPFSLFEDCSTFIEKVILSGMSGKNKFFQAYCAYAFAMGVEYTAKGDAPMAVVMDTAMIGESTKGVGGISFVINPIVTFSVFESEFEVLFCIAHEVKHLLLKHLLKYNDLYKENTTGVILNLCNDVEVNESLKTELEARGFGSKAYPSSCFDMDSIARILGGVYTSEYLYRVYRNVKDNKGYDSLSDMLYKFFDEKCKTTLGYDIESILYRVQVAKTTFNEEIFKTAESGLSSVFRITDSAEAKRFCSELAKYLTRCKYAMLIVGGGFGSDTADGGSPSEGDSSNGSSSGEGSKGDSRGCSGIVSIDEKMTTGMLGILLDTIEDLKDVYMSAINPSLGSKGRGVGTGGKQTLVPEEFRSTLPWQKMLERYLTSLSQEKIYSKKRINRRQPMRLELSGTLKEPTLTLIVAVDDSGSISKDESNYFFSEFSAIAEKFKCDVHFYRFTGDVQEYKYIKKKDLLRVLKSKVLSSYRYNGGTSFQPVFDAVQKNSKIKLSKAVLVMLTDGDGEREVDFGKVKNRIWVVTRSEETKDIVKISCPEAKKNIFPVVPIRR